MNVYDFDKTIYAGDSTLDFYRYCLRKQPLLLRYLPRQLSGVFLYALRRIGKEGCKERFFSFLQGLEEPESAVRGFWDKHERGIRSWYRERQREDDLIISASPAFLLKDICSRLGIRRLLASDVAITDGRFLGPNCRGEEKLRRFEAAYGGEEIGEFYSDSLSDEPLARRARRAYLVGKNGISEWKGLKKREVD